MVNMQGVEGVNMFVRVLDDLNKKGRYEDIKKSIINEKTTGIYFTAQIPKGKKLYRCRIHRDGEYDIKFNNASQIGYRHDKHNILVFGRCNEKEQSLFYAAEYEFTSIMETKRPDDQGKTLIATIGEWMITEDPQVAFVIQPYPDNRKHPYERSFGGLYDAEMAQASKERKIVTDLYFAFMNDKYRNPQNTSYMLTTAYANFCLDHRAGLVYPSVKEVNSYNVAFRSDVQDKQLLQLTSVSKGEYKPRFEGAEFEADYEIKKEMCKNVDNKSGVIEWQS